jgi:hypothetical protein
MKALWLRLGTLGVLLTILAPSPVAAVSRELATREVSYQIQDFNTPAAQLRVTLDTALAEHAFLVGEAIRSGLEMGPDFDAVGTALEGNTSDLIDLVADVYGAPAGDAFGDLWRSHIAYLIDYTRAKADGDASAQQLAEHQLHTYVDDFSAFLANANPNLPQAVVAELVDEHVSQLESIAAFASGDYGEAYPAVHKTYTHMFEIGDALAEAIALQFPDRFTGKSLAFSPAGDLRIALDRLLGEHTTLAVTAMRAGVTGADDEPAAQDALGSNTEAIGSWVADVYGKAAASAFLDLWTEHTDAYLDYVNSSVAGDTLGQNAALDRLGAYQHDFSSFLAGANPKLSASALESLLEHHTHQLIAQADAYAAGDYDQAYALARETFRHAVTMGDALALAIAAQFPDLFPDTALQAQPAAPIPWLLVLLLAGAVLAGSVTRTRAGRLARAKPG